MQRQSKGLNIKGRKLYTKASALAFLLDAVVFPFSEYDSVCWKELDGSGGIRLKSGIIKKIHFSLDGISGNGGCVTLEGVRYMFGNANETHFRIEVEVKNYDSLYVFTKDNIGMLFNSRTVITEKTKKGDIYKK